MAYAELEILERRPTKLRAVQALTKEHGKQKGFTRDAFQMPPFTETVDSTSWTQSWVAEEEYSRVARLGGWRIAARLDFALAGRRTNARKG